MYKYVNINMMSTVILISLYNSNLIIIKKKITTI
jgi:hypothetical protein